MYADIAARAGPWLMAQRWVPSRPDGCGLDANVLIHGVFPFQRSRFLCLIPARKIRVISEQLCDLVVRQLITEDDLEQKLKIYLLLCRLGLLRDRRGNIGVAGACGSIW
jgi:hypothetical protein